MEVKRLMNKPMDSFFSPHVFWFLIYIRFSGSDAAWATYENESNPAYLLTNKSNLCSPCAQDGLGYAFAQVKEEPARAGDTEQNVCPNPSPSTAGNGQISRTCASTQCTLRIQPWHRQRFP